MEESTSDFSLENYLNKAVEPSSSAGGESLPYIHPFDESTSIDGYTILDVNGDGGTISAAWVWYQKYGYKRLHYSYGFDPADDWIITPSLATTANQAYEIQLNAWNDDLGFPEDMPGRLEIAVGYRNNLAGMSNIVLGPTEIWEDSTKIYRVRYCLTEANPSYVGIHCISDAYKGDLVLKGLNVIPIANDLPAAINDLKVTSAENGDLEATLSFTAPSTYVNGDKITGTLKCRITRNGEEVETFTMEPGQKYDRVDKSVPERGFYTYKVIASTESGEALPAELKVYVGFDQPVAPQNVTIEETSTLGTVSVAWDPVTVDVNGKKLPTDGRTTYTVASVRNGKVSSAKTGHTNTKVTHKFMSATTKQRFYRAAVWGNVDDIKGDTAVTRSIPVGKAYTEYNQSFTNEDRSDYIIESENLYADAVWELDKKEFYFPSQDNDQNCYTFTTGYIGGEAAAVTGKINFGDMKNPYVKFWIVNFVGVDQNDNEIPNLNVLKVQIREHNTLEWTTILEGVVDELCKGKLGWCKFNAPLGSMAGKDFQIRWVITAKNLGFASLDNIEISTLYQNDLIASDIVAPATAYAGTDFNVSANIFNDGATDAKNFDVVLYADGEEAQAENVEFLEAGGTMNASFTVNLLPHATAPIDYKIGVRYSADNNIVNDTTSTLTLTPNNSKLPAPKDLAATPADGSGVKLTWNAPVYNSDYTEQNVTEDFEKATPYTSEVEGWTFLDMDGGENGGLSAKFEVPGHEVFTRSSFWVHTNYDNVYADYEEYDAHSGHQYLANMFMYWAGTLTDDWAISPALTGKAQTISFFAKVYDGFDTKHMSVLYSTSTTNPADFKPVPGAEDIQMSNDTWKQFTYQLPEGAMYFAIRDHSADGRHLYIDDVTFTRGNVTANLNILGYNIYRDDKLINTTPVTETTFVDAEGTAQSRYRVAVVYDRGLGLATGEVGVTTALNDLSSDNLSISTDKGMIIVSGTEGLEVSITSVDGRTIYRSFGDATISVQPAIYIVKAGQTVQKVAVR